MVEAGPWAYRPAKPWPLSSACRRWMPTSSSSPAAPAPLWYDVLAEAATVGEGRILGPVGGGIVGEVILELLAADPASFVNAKQPWAPFLGNRPNECTLTDLVAYATGMNGFRWERPRVLPMQRVRRE
jgi:hypothetical protein